MENACLSFRYYEINAFTEKEWLFLSEIENKIFAKLCKLKNTKEVVADVFLGASPGKHFHFTISNKSKNGYVEVRSEKTKKVYIMESKAFHAYVRGQDIDRFSAYGNKSLLLYPYRKENGNYKLIDWKDFKKEFPKAATYLENHKLALSKRSQINKKPDEWYGYTRASSLRYFTAPKIICRRLGERFTCALDFKGRFAVTDSIVGINYQNNLDLDPHYLLAVLNHPISTLYLNKTTNNYTAKANLYYGMDIESLPIYTDFSKATKRKVHDQISADTKTLISLLKKGDKKEAKALRRQIHNAIYKLYKLLKKGLAEPHIFSK